MLREMFIGRQPSHFQINPIVRAFIVAEMLFGASWNFSAPIFAIFAASVPGGKIEIAASSFSTYLIVRVIFELISGRYLNGSGELRKFFLTIVGTLIISLAYIGFAFTQSVVAVYLFYGIFGVGLGIASPAKNALFSSHLDKNKETIEWGMMDAAVLICVAMAASLGGFIANRYGFQLLFLIATIINLLGIIPYILYIHQERQDFYHRLIYAINNFGVLSNKISPGEK